MKPKTERFEMRLDPAILKRVDNWRAGQTGLPSRAEAVRRLMETSLSINGGPLKFSDGEKLIMFMLCDLYKHFKVDGEIDPSFVAAALHGGHYWGLEWQYTGIFHDHEDNKKAISEVVDVLDVWWFIEQSYGKLSKKDKAGVEKKADPFGKHVTFPGFDGNNESEHLGIARFLIDELDRFSDFKGRDLNSHAPLLGSYLRMLPVFEPMRQNLGGGNFLSANQIIDLLNAQRYDGRALA